jgi:hypothetical protein
MARRDVHVLPAMAALTVALLLVQAATGAEVLMASPFLVLALALLAGRYVASPAERGPPGPARFALSAQPPRLGHEGRQGCRYTPCDARRRPPRWRAAPRRLTT